ncbi:polyprenyl synthetase family protein [Dactylosporangium sp. CA-139066]|uniref:polyprenyl synthetase family protein n=1 Tax=Dactylosporangium sp. CA-139066 TaxID=3239930 RepID=UPI003D9411C2
MTATRTDSVSDAMRSISQRIEPELRAAVDALDERNRLVAGYQLGFWDAEGEPATGSGKGLRPTLAMVCAGAAGGDRDVAVPAAVAVELVHSFSLLHDDVMDMDTTRRHRATAWTVYGLDAAILAGDALLLLAMQKIAEGGRAEAAERLAADVHRLLAGQAADAELERAPTATLAAAMDMAAGKTAALCAGACALGAILAGASAEVVGRLSAYGHHLGLAYQLRDDLLGVWGDPRQTGKPVGSDVRSRKKSIPVAYALQHDSAAGRRLAARYSSGDPVTVQEVAVITALLHQCGADEWTAERAEAECEAALAQLDGAGLDPGERDLLAAIAAFAAGRDR